MSIFERVLELFYGPLDNYKTEPSNFEDLLRIEKEFEKNKLLKKYTNLYKEFRQTKLKSGLAPDIPLEEQLRYETSKEYLKRIYGINDEIDDKINDKIKEKYNREKILVKI